MAIITLNNNSLSSVTSLPAAISTGKVLQIQTTTKTDTFSTSSTTFTDITGMSVSITPTSSSNKIFVMAHLNMAHGASRAFHVRLLRDSTDLHKGDTASSRIRSTLSLTADEANATVNSATNSFQYLDSPSTTSATTYKLQGRIGSTNASYVNRYANDGDNAQSYRAVSGITVMEIKG
jgi:hypothetical protein